jgi:hypothetical protein
MTAQKFSTIHRCKPQTRIQTVSCASAFISIRLSECGLISNALEINSKAVFDSGNVFFLRSCLDWDIQSTNLCSIGKMMSMR